VSFVVVGGVDEERGEARGTGGGGGEEGGGKEEGREAHLEIVIHRVPDQNPVLEEVRDLFLDVFEWFCWGYVG
jgi:hypothetical protein